MKKPELLINRTLSGLQCILTVLCMLQLPSAQLRTSRSAQAETRTSINSV